MTTRRATLLLGIGATLVCLVLLEVSAAIIFRRSPNGNGKRLVLSALRGNDRFVSVSDSYIEPHPYLLYTPRPGYEEFGFKQINSLGYRGHDFSIEKTPGTFRILCLGGSTTLSYPYIKDPEQAWPGLLEARLNEHYPGRKFEVINAGLGYATTAELLAGYMFRHRYLKADMVIIHEGGNDADAMLFENYNPEYTHFRAPGVRLLVGKVERALLHSNVFRIFYMRYWRYVPSIYVAQPYGFDHVDRPAALQRVQDTYPLGFERNLDLIVRTAQNDSARVMLVGFVAAPEAIFARTWPSVQGLEHAAILGIEKNLQIMEEIAEKYDIRYLSPSTVTMKDDWFLDGCHLTEEGEQTKASWILAGVVRELDGTP